MSYFNVLLMIDLIVPKNTLRNAELLEGLEKPRKTFIIMVIIYYNKRIHIQLAKVCRVQPVRKLAQASGVFPWWSHTGTLNFLSNNMWQYVQSVASQVRSAKLGVQCFTWDKSHRHAVWLTLSTQTPTSLRKTFVHHKLHLLA